VDLGRLVLLNPMMRRLVPTAERTVIRGEAKVPELFALDWRPAIRERLPVGKGFVERFCRVGRCGQVFDLLLRYT
jgi:hypothetical protein